MVSSSGAQVCVLIWWSSLAIFMHMYGLEPKCALLAEEEDIRHARCADPIAKHRCAARKELGSVCYIYCAMPCCMKHCHALAGRELGTGVSLGSCV